MAGLSMLAGWFLPDFLIREDSSFIIGCLLTALREILMFGIPAGLMLNRANLSQVQLRKALMRPDPYGTGLTLLCAVSFVLAGSLITGVFAMLLETLGIPVLVPQTIIPETLPDLIVASLTIALVTAACEELFFRFALMKLLAARLNQRVAALISGALFAILHLSLIGFPALFLFALFQHRLFSKKGTLLLPILFHAMYNFSILVLNYSGASPGFSAILLSTAVFVPGARYLFREEPNEADHSGV